MFMRVYTYMLAGAVELCVHTVGGLGAESGEASSRPRRQPA